MLWRRSYPNIMSDWVSAFAGSQVLISAGIISQSFLPNSEIKLPKSKQPQLHFFQLKWTSMQWTQPMLHYSSPMRSCGIAFIFYPVVHRVKIMCMSDVFVTIGFGQYRSCRDRKIPAVTFHYSFMGDIMVWIEIISIYYNESKFGFQFIKRLMHGQYWSLKNIYFIDLQTIYGCDSKIQCIGLDILSESIPAFLWEQLGVCQYVMVIING